MKGKKIVSTLLAIAMLASYAPSKPLALQVMNRNRSSPLTRLQTASRMTMASIGWPSMRLMAMKKHVGQMNGAA